jgi:butyrate kinase
MRLTFILKFLSDNSVDLSSIDVIVARGGLVEPTTAAFTSSTSI